MNTLNNIVNSKPVESLTNFFKEIVGKPLVDGAGILYADAIRAKRISNSLKLEQKYSLIKSEETKKADLGFGYKLLEKASLEDNEDILSKWANLLGNATDEKFEGSIRKIFIDILDSLDPIDADVFDKLNKFCLKQETKYSTLITFDNSNSFEKESLTVLLSLGLITYGVTTSPNIQIGGYASTTFHGLDSFSVTELGQSFYKAITR